MEDIMATYYHDAHHASIMPNSLFISHNAGFSRAVCDGRLHDKMGDTTIHATGQRVQRQSASLC